MTKIVRGQDEPNLVLQLCVEQMVHMHQTFLCILPECKHPLFGWRKTGGFRLVLFMRPLATSQIFFFFLKKKAHLSFTGCIRHLMRHLVSLCWCMRAVSRAARSLFVQHVGMPSTKPPVKQILASRATQENNALSGIQLPRLALDEAAKAPGW